MKPSTLATGLLLTTLALAGCIAQSAPGPVVGPSAAGPSPLVAAPTDAGPKAIAITGFYRDYPTGAGVGCLWLPPGCDPFAVTFGINFTGTMTGEAMGVAHGGPSGFDPAQPDRISGEKSPVTFTGSIDGCGTGSLSFLVKYAFVADAGGPRTNETGRFIPGSATTGFAGVTDVFWAFDDGSTWPTPVPIHGTAWCL